MTRKLSYCVGMIIFCVGIASDRSGKAIEPAIENAADENKQAIKAEVRGTLHFEAGHGYFLSVKPAEKPERDMRVWLWISEDKALVRQLQGLNGKEVIALGKLAQMPETTHASVPPLGMYMSRFEIKDAGAP